MTDSATPRSSTPGLLFHCRNGDEVAAQVDELVGKEFNGIASSGEGVLAICKDGLFSLTPVVNEISDTSTDVKEKDIIINNLSAVGYTSAAGGQGFFVGVSDTGNVYTWGSQGDHGQLGLGACVQSVMEPSMICHGSRFTSVHCGEAFTIALDDRGGAYSWGENFDRQLGLYTKGKKDMHLQNAMIEDMSFAPRLMPLSVKLKISKIACGLRFALAIERNGRLFSWGAGECGQLGTGRCTYRELPQMVNLHSEENEEVQANKIVIDIACGSAHCLAVVTERTNDEQSSSKWYSPSGCVYSWGLNSCGQLGNGLSKAVHRPQQITEFYSVIKDVQNASDNNYPSPLFDSDGNSLQYRSVFASQHSSAAIDSCGRLFTWGSTSHNRLMHKLPLKAPDRDKKLVEYAALARKKLNMGALGAVTQQKAAEAAAEAEAVAASVLKPMTSVSFPTMVTSPHFEGSRISSFAFSKTTSAALIMTAIEKVYPVEGPKRSFSKLEIFGEGFWDTPSIIVKFTFKGQLPDGGVLPDIAGRSNQEDSSSSAVAMILAAGMNPPRSCAGKYVSSKKIICKPPKFADVGIYTVAVSMDGTDFLPTTSSILVHKDLSVTSQKPELWDLNEQSGSPGGPIVIPELLLGVKGLNPSKQVFDRDYFVRIQFVKLVGTGLPPLESRSSAAMVSRQQTMLQNALPVELVVKGKLVADRNSPLLLNVPISEGVTEDEFTFIRCEEVDMQALVEYCNVQKFVALLEMRCSVSLNGQDYSTLQMAIIPSSKAAATHAANNDNEVDSSGVSAKSEILPPSSAPDSSTKLSPPATLIYNFKPVEVKPSCASITNLMSNIPAASAGTFASSSGSSCRSSSENDRMEQLQRVIAAEVTALGSSFLPSSRLPKGCAIEARLQPKLDKAIVTADGDLIEAQNLEDQRREELILSVKCDSVSKLSMGISLAQIMALQRILDDLLTAARSSNHADCETRADLRVAYLPCNISFYLKSLDSITDDKLLHPTRGDEVLTLNLYNSQPQCIVPSCIRQQTEHSSRFAVFLKRTGFLFDSSSMQVYLHIPKKRSSQVIAPPGFGLDSDVWYPAIQLPEAAARMLPIQKSKNENSELEKGSVNIEGDGELMKHDIDHALNVDDDNTGDDADGAVRVSQEVRYWVELELQPLSTYSPQLLLELQKKEKTRLSIGGSTASSVSIAPDDACFSPQFACVSVVLDGGDIESPDMWAKIFFHKSLASYNIETSAPKGGFGAGTSVSLLLSEYCPTVDQNDAEPLLGIELPSSNPHNSDELKQLDGVDSEGKLDLLDKNEVGGNESNMECEAVAAVYPPRPQECVVQIRGAATDDLPDGAVVACEAIVEDVVGGNSEDSNEEDAEVMMKSRVIFQIPSGVAAAPGMVPHRTQGKEKFYCVDVSMDGGRTFDRREEALLSLK